MKLSMTSNNYASRKSWMTTLKMPQDFIRFLWQFWMPSLSPTFTQKHCEVHIYYFVVSTVPDYGLEYKGPGSHFNIKMTSAQYRKSHCGDETILRPSFLHNGISYTGKTTSLYWIRLQSLKGWYWPKAPLTPAMLWLTGRSTARWTVTQRNKLQYIVWGLSFLRKIIVSKRR